MKVKERASQEEGKEIHLESSLGEEFPDGTFEAMIDMASILYLGRFSSVNEESRGP